jgi:hypothetical protein
MDLHLPLKKVYFDQIVSGEKREEYRLVTDYWRKRLIGRQYTRVVITAGYPKRDDASRRSARAWRGFSIKTITHPHFGDKPVEVFAIDVSSEVSE